MWIDTNELIKIESFLKNDFEDKKRILLYFYLIDNNFYHTLKEREINNLIKSLKNVNLDEMVDINYFFFREQNIVQGWENIDENFKKKYPNIYSVLEFLKKKFIQIPIFYNKKYIKNVSLIG